MKKEKQIKTHQRRTKSGKSVIVRAHTAKYDAAEELKKMSKKKGAGDELESRKRQTPIETPDLGFTDAEFKEWYHWDQEGDPKNKTALKVEKALIAKMGKRAYNKYFNDLSDSYSARGHSKAYKSLVAEHTEVPTPKTPKMETSKSKKVPSRRLSPKETDDFLSGKPGAISPKSATLKDVMGVKLPRANKFGESSVEMSAKQRNAAIERALNSGWKIESSNEYSSGKWMLLSNGEYTMSIHTGRDKIFNDVVITKTVTPKKETPVVGTTEKTSWGHTSKEKGKSVRTLDGRGQTNYAGITSSGLKLPKKFSYDSDTHSDWYDSFRTKDSASIENVVSQAKKAKWQKGGSGKMVRYTSPDGRVHILVDKGNKSASIFYR